MGFFSKDYESAGVGISKNAPKKSGAKLFFDIFLRKFWKLIEVNLLYMLFYIPLIVVWFVIANVNNVKIALIVTILMLILFALTIGPATAGMTKVLRNYVLEKHSFIINDFFKAFRQNYKKAAVIGFIDVIMCLSVYAGTQIYPALAKQMNSNLMYVALVLSLSVALVVLMMNFYAYLMIIATDLSFKNLIKNSFALAFLAIKKSFLTFVIAAAILLALAFIPMYILVLILPFFPAAFIGFVICFNSYPVIQKYVINPFYESMGQINPELVTDDPEDDEVIFEDMGGKEKPIEKRKKGKGKRIS